PFQSVNAIMCTHAHPPFSMSWMVRPRSIPSIANAAGMSTIIFADIPPPLLPDIQFLLASVTQPPTADGVRSIREEFDAGVPPAIVARRRHYFDLEVFRSVGLVLLHAIQQEAAEASDIRWRHLLGNSDGEIKLLRLV